LDTIDLVLFVIVGVVAVVGVVYFIKVANED